MSLAFDWMNGIVRDLVIGDYTPTNLDFVFFALVFFSIYGAIFTATAYIPMFNPAQNKEKYVNIRMLISISISFIGTITSFATILSYFHYFSLVFLASVVLLILLLALLPKSVRENKKVVIPLAVLALFIGFVFVFSNAYGTGWLTALWNLVAGWFDRLIGSMQSWQIIVIIFVAATIISAVISYNKV